MKLKNILIVVKDIEKSKQFYHDLFGLDVLLDKEENVILTEGLVLQDETIWREFLGKNVISENNSCELYFEEQDIESFVKKLERLYPSIQYVSRLATDRGGQNVVRFYDLDGNLIEVRAPYSAKMICKIRKWELSDAVDLAATLSNKKIQNNLRDGLPYPYTERDGEEYISAMLSADENETFAFAVIVDDKVVGSIGVFRQENIHRQTAELGYYLAEEYWGKGIMTEAVRQICEYVFKKSDIIRIYAEPFAYNIASCRVLEKAGFQCEGTLKSNAVKNGKITDMKMYALCVQDTL